MTSSALALTYAFLVVSANAGWRPVARTGKVAVYTRPVSGFSVDEMCATMKVSLPPETLWRVLSDVGHFPEFMPYVTETRILESTRRQSGTTCQTEYHRVAPPLIRGRDYTLLIESDVAADRRRFVRRWRTANERGPSERDDTVRVHVASGSWTVEALGHDTSQVTYKLLTDPGGSIPGWIANRANVSSLPGLLEAVHARAQSLTGDMGPSSQP